MVHKICSNPTMVEDLLTQIVLCTLYWSERKDNNFLRLEGPLPFYKYQSLHRMCEKSKCEESHSEEKAETKSKKKKKKKTYMVLVGHKYELIPKPAPTPKKVKPQRPRVTLDDLPPTLLDDLLDLEEEIAERSNRATSSK
ncbi:hypothetical protein FQA39_LY14815 [Lamprigera yunnana]|nr:hypothetical protein FQA39_LY14815 [Lamprigera yunnana]